MFEFQKQSHCELSHLRIQHHLKILNKTHFVFFFSFSFHSFQLFTSLNCLRVPLFPQLENRLLEGILNAVLFSYSHSIILKMSIFVSEVRYSVQSYIVSLSFFSEYLDTCHSHSILNHLSSSFSFSNTF